MRLKNWGEPSYLRKVFFKTQESYLRHKDYFERSAVMHHDFLNSSINTLRKKQQNLGFFKTSEKKEIDLKILELKTELAEAASLFPQLFVRTQ